MRQHARVSRRSFLATVGALGCATVHRVTSARPTELARVRRIGLAFGDDPEGGVPVFRDTLRELGYVEGQNLVIDTRQSQQSSGDANPAAGLARTDPEFLVGPPLPLAPAARAPHPPTPPSLL